MVSRNEWNKKGEGLVKAAAKMNLDFLDLMGDYFLPIQLKLRRLSHVE
jgi:hypothetical protein